MSVESAQAGNDKLESVVESKLLDFNVDKSVYLVIGPKGAKNSIENELKERPLKLCNQKQKSSLAEKYLGDVIDSTGLAQSVHETVIKKRAK